MKPPMYAKLVKNCTAIGAAKFRSLK